MTMNVHQQNSDSLLGLLARRLSYCQRVKLKFCSRIKIHAWLHHYSVPLRCNISNTQDIALYIIPGPWSKNGYDDALLFSLCIFLIRNINLYLLTSDSIFPF